MSSSNLLPDLNTGFLRGRSGGLVFPSLSEFSTRVQYHFLASPPLSPYPLPSLVSNCSNLSFSTLERSWSLESVPYKQRTGDTVGPQGSAQFQFKKIIFFMWESCSQKQKLRKRPKKSRQYRLKKNKHLHAVKSIPLRDGLHGNFDLELEGKVSECVCILRSQFLEWGKNWEIDNIFKSILLQKT